MRLRWSMLLVVALSLAGAIGVVHAQPTVSDNPWSEGVSTDQQEQALRLYEAGNKHLYDADYEAAWALFDSALATWQHPSIHFNMSVALLHMNREVEAYEHLLAALRYGAEALDSEDVYRQGLVYKQVLEQVVARLAVACAEPDARVTLDGTYLFTGPGEGAVWVLVGEHQVVATRPDRRTLSETVQVVPHVYNRVAMARWPKETQRVLVQRWDSWKPWAVSAFGAGAVLLGVPLQLRARANFEAFDSGVADVCNPQCERDDPAYRRLEGLRARGRLQNQVAVTSFVVGGAALAGGLVLVFLNRPRSREIPSLVVTPEVGGQGVMLRGSVSF